MFNKGVLVIISLCSLSIGQAYSQLQQRNILKTPSATINQRVLKQNQDVVLELPFWDDFSQSNGTPNPELWENSENVLININSGENPPTLNVATFDGTDAFGFPYDINSDFVGNTDNLTSRPIDLSNITANNLNSVFISFFWQALGKGEIPNEVDSLRLQFLTVDSLWITQFRLIGGENTINTDENGNQVFVQEILKVDGAEYFHNQFRFRFQAFGNLTGGFDTWHIDYVFLNENRDFADLSYFDRGITMAPSSLLGEYSSMPSDLFFADPSRFVSPLRFELFNLDALPHPVEFTVDIIDLTSNTLVDRTNEPTTTPILAGLERRIIESNVPDLSSLSQQDSIILETEIIYNTGDQNLIRFINPVSGDTTFYDNVNFKVNDTLRRTFTLHDYLAYDDGTAEFAAGINQIRGQLAYQYYIPSGANLTDIDIYFPRISTSNDGLPIEIIVWRRLSDEPGSLIAKQPFTITQQDQLNQFTRYTLENPVFVQDTIYIGWEQFSDNFIGVGLDKNTDNGDKIFVNIDGEWRPNVGIEGTLMLRPIFRKTEATVITDVDQELKNVQVYPNPNNGTFTVEDPFDEIKILDLSGKSLPFSRDGNQISINSPVSGTVILTLLRGSEVTTRKILVR